MILVPARCYVFWLMCVAVRLGGAVRESLRPTFDSELKMKHVFQLDPWLQTLAMLSSCSGLKPGDCDDEYFDQLRRRTSLLSRASRGKVKRAARNVSDTCATIRILERLSPSAVALSWHDPTSLNYAEQVWWMSGAPKNGRCAVSGARILRGQSVYRPRRSGKDVPLNGSEMILTSVIVGACESSADIPHEGDEDGKRVLGCVISQGTEAGPAC